MLRRKEIRTPRIVLAGDIGETNTRLALFRVTPPHYSGKVHNERQGGPHGGSLPCHGSFGRRMSGLIHDYDFKFHSLQREFPNQNE
jgi:hypothetical protein